MIENKMKFENALDQFEQRMSNIVSDSYSVLLKDLNDYVEKLLRNKLNGKRGLEDNLKKEVRALRKTLSDSEDIDVIKDNSDVRKSSFEFRDEEKRETYPVKRWNRATKNNSANGNSEESLNEKSSSKLSYNEISSYVRETSEESNGSRKRSCRDNMKATYDLDDEDQSDLKDKSADKETKPKRRKSAAKEEKPSDDNENSDEITWPPKTGSMIATLYEDGFYIGRVKSVNAKDNTVDVFYMERYKGHKDGESNIEDKYWVWPDAYELFSTEKWSVFGENIMIHLAENVASDEKAVFMLQGFQMWKNLAKSSKKGMIEIE